MTDFDRDGYRLVASALDVVACDALTGALDALDGAGSRRLLERNAVAIAAGRLAAHPAIAPLLPADAIAVQCTLFVKTPAAPWSVAPHQDVCIPVAERVDATACSGWSVKEGVLHTQPPCAVLESLVAVRLQLDDGAEHTGPLEVVPGSHRDGRLDPPVLAAIPARVRVACVVPKGGAVVLRPLLVHASRKGNRPGLRRVLHVLFGPRRLPLGLRWASALGSD